MGHGKEAVKMSFQRKVVCSSNITDYIFNCFFSSPWKLAVLRRTPKIVSIGDVTRGRPDTGCEMVRGLARGTFSVGAIYMSGTTFFAVVVSIVNDTIVVFWVVDQ